MNEKGTSFVNIINEPIKWDGDDSIYCAVRWRGMFAQAEKVDDERWYMSVFDLIDSVKKISSGMMWCTKAETAKSTCEAFMRLHAIKKVIL